METLARLEQTITSRRSAPPEESYVALLNSKGIEVVAQKLGEEATEAVIAAVTGNRKDLIAESADVLFHLIVLLNSSDLTLADVMAELDRREGVSGIDEKASRSS